MDALTEHDRLANKIPEVLAGLLGVRPAEVDVVSEAPSGADLVVHSAGQIIVIEFKKTTSAGSVAAAAKRVKEYARLVDEQALPLVAVPFMGDVGRKACEEAGVSWLDLSGNARIVAPGIRVIVSGQPNLFRSAGRPSNLFAPKSSRVVRWLLIHADKSMSQREIALSTGLDEGFVSRLVARLENESFVVRDERGAVRPENPALLLDAWREVYRFSKHAVRLGHVAARSGDTLLWFVHDILSERKVEHAATGLAAAWAHTRFAAFRTVTMYLSEDPPLAALKELGWGDDPRGANLWLVVPNDAGVLQGVAEVNGIPCVHPLQVYLDLKDQPERSAEAAERFRTEFLTWRSDG